MKNDTYVVVENAGYNDERDVRGFDSYQDASAFCARNYSADERDPESPEYIRVDIRLDRDDGTSTYI